MTLIELLKVYTILQKEGLYDDLIDYCTNKKGTNE